MVGESRFGGITRGGFFGLMLVGGLVVGLFFIPELLQLRSKSAFEKSAFEEARGARSRASTAASSNIVKDVARSDATSRVASTSTSTENLESPQSASTSETHSTTSWGWWNDIKGWFAGLTSPRLAQVARNREGSRHQVRDDTRASLSSVAQRMDSDSDALSWATIRSPESKDALGQARRDAMELSRGLPTSAVNSRFAMIDFANGLDFVMTKADQQMTPRDAVIYMTKLDQSVTRALAQENVERVFVKRWSQLSLGPVLGKTMLGQSHDTVTTPFNPQLTLTELRVRHVGMHRGDPNTGKVDVSISGYLIGSDIDKVTMEANNGAIVLPVYIKRDPRGYWFFNRGTIDGRKKWKFTVYNKLGEQYEKRYQFYPKVGGFRYDSKLGYQIPFHMERARVGEFRSDNFDPRLDQFFALSEGGDEALNPNAIYATF